MRKLIDLEDGVIMKIREYAFRDNISVKGYIEKLIIGHCGEGIIGSGNISLLKGDRVPEPFKIVPRHIPKKVKVKKDLKEEVIDKKEENIEVVIKKRPSIIEEDIVTKNRLSDIWKQIREDK